MPLKSTDTLQAGQPYTFTFSHGRILEYRSDPWVKGQLSSFLKNWGEVVSAKRELFSGRYIVVIVPSVTTVLRQWTEEDKGFDYAWETMGYGNAVLVEAVGGESSSQPGGIKQAIPNISGGISDTVGQALSAGIKPLAPYIAAIVAILLLLEYSKGRRL